MNALVNTNDIFDTAKSNAPVRVGPRGGTTTQPPKKMNHTYEAIVDLMLTHPEWRNTDIAKHLNYSLAWLSVITGTDMFKAYYASRRAAFNQAVNERISGKLSEATEEALDSLIEGIKTKGAAMTVIERKEVADTLLQRLGYGVKTGPTVVNNVNAVAETVVAVDRDVLVQARQSLRAVEELRIARQKSLVVESEVVQETPQPAASPILDLLVE